ncbi:MAG: serine hydrolase [Bacteroidetes bacterium]|nr:MAG: serine hydrolase [Bacteroidota bacterium]
MNIEFRISNFEFSFRISDFDIRIYHKLFFMRKILLYALANLFVVAAFSQESKTNDKRIAELEPQFEKVLKDWKAVGFAVAVVNRNKVIYSKGFGYRDYAKKIPVTTNTLFAIGSCTKAFTASLIGMLDNNKVVDIDKPAHNYLPDLAFYNNGMTDNITLRDMMCHRTGLPRHDYSWYLFSTSSRDSLVKRIQYMEPTGGVRDKWQYNNFMFMLQGVIAEKLTGQKWEQNIRSKILTPLNMTRTNFSVLDMAKDSDASLGYYIKNDSIIKKINYYNIDAMGPAGSINSSVNEMSHWVITWIEGGKFNGKEIIPSSFREQAISSQMVIGAAFPEQDVPDVFFSNYGFGWSLVSYRGHYRVEHGGNIDGFSASTCFFPTDSIGIIVLTNQNGSAVPSIVRNLIADKVLNLPYIDWSVNRKKVVDKAKAAALELKKNSTSMRKPGTKPSHPLKDYEGAFVNPGYGTMEIFENDDSLFARTSTKIFWLRHYNYDVFEPFEKDPEEGIDTSDAGQLKIQFNMDVNGTIQSALMALEPALKPIEFNKKEKEVALTAEMLQKYVGEYELGAGTARVYIKSNTLYLFVAGQPEYELASLGSDKFTIKSLTGYSLQFQKDEKNEIVSVSFIQPNGTFKASKKK